MMCSLSSIRLIFPAWSRIVLLESPWAGGFPPQHLSNIPNLILICRTHEVTMKSVVGTEEKEYVVAQLFVILLFSCIRDPD